VRRHEVVLLIAVAALASALLWPRGNEPPPSPYCRVGTPLAGVYHPDRLRMRKRCALRAGTVTRVTFEQYDGDVHVDLETTEGRIVVEIIPQDRAVVPVPAEGSRVSVVGPLVDDLEHGWPEIHPAWWISSGTIRLATAGELDRAETLLRDER
jgi:hypothetical protein